MDRKKMNLGHVWRTKGPAHNVRGPAAGAASSGTGAFISIHDVINYGSSTMNSGRASSGGFRLEET